MGQDSAQTSAGLVAEAWIRDQISVTQIQKVLSESRSSVTGPSFVSSTSIIA